MQTKVIRVFPILLIALLPGCDEMGATPAETAQDCDSMGLILNDPTQPEFLHDQVRQAMAEDGCL
jgi:hypothetical protein